MTSMRMLPSATVFSSQILPRMQPPSLATARRWFQFRQELPALSFSYSLVLKPIAVSLSIPAILSDLWDSVLRAAPKKKTSHMKRRHRQMAGKALKDVKSLSSCPACGGIKRAHVLCPHCVKEVKNQWRDAQRNTQTA